MTIPTITETDHAVTGEPQSPPNGGSTILAIWTGFAIIHPERNKRAAVCRGGCARSLAPGEGYRVSAPMIRFPWYECEACTDRRVDEAQMDTVMGDKGYRHDEKGGLSVGGPLTVAEALEMLGGSDGN